MKVVPIAAESEFIIESNVPVPERTGRSTYPFAQMKAGESFVVPVAMRAKVNSAVSYWARRHPDFAYVTRTTGDQVRIWRI